ncbi:DUF2867 domain-containing protein [Pseudorhodoferax soli]|uniref:Uncharacterized protein DUF2867 n=1 Tax=Pseudorhodoferax soli TaxID=545864 RepID=A0A368XW41_9BURK|nr:DUF2867 domain-containing protein [Pseudorhodoferax soli]RCW71356.1 uncharacterized protein DUF2867 [Pseudorhodoferax soli]
MPPEFTPVTAVALPAQSRIANAYASVNLADAFSIRLPPNASGDPEVLARFIFSHQAPWVGRLMRVRDALVAGFGLKTGKHLAALGGSASRSRVGIFKVYSTSASEIVLGEDDQHLDFRVSVLCTGEPASEGGRQLVVSTVVHCHDRLGRAYILLIAPFHRQVVRSSLRSAARKGWPQATGA